LIQYGTIEASQGSCTEERGMMRTLLRSTVVMAPALLGGAPVAAPSGDEAAVAEAVEAFLNAMLKADRA
jgi:hypothetical protein